jgi:hypothetical protein
MPLPFRPPIFGQPVSARDARARDDQARANIPGHSPGTLTDRKPGGTTVSSLPEFRQRRHGSTFINFPFRVFQYAPTGSPAASDWRTFRVHHGRVLLESDAEKQLDPDNDDAAGTPTNIIVPASSDFAKIYLRVTFAISGGVATVDDSSATILGTDDSGWTGWPDTLDATHFYFLLAEIETSADPSSPSPPPYLSGTYTITQHRTANIYLPFFIPDPTVSPNPDANDCINLLLVQ